MTMFHAQSATRKHPLPLLWSRQSCRVHTTGSSSTEDFLAQRGRTTRDQTIFVWHWTPNILKARAPSTQTADWFFLSELNVGHFPVPHTPRVSMCHVSSAPSNCHVTFDAYMDNDFSVLYDRLIFCNMWFFSTNEVFWVFSRCNAYHICILNYGKRFFCLVYFFFSYSIYRNNAIYVYRESHSYINQTIYEHRILKL